MQLIGCAETVGFSVHYYNSPHCGGIIGVVVARGGGGGVNAVCVRGQVDLIFFSSFFGMNIKRLLWPTDSHQD